MTAVLQPSAELNARKLDFNKLRIVHYSEKLIFYSSSPMIGYF